METPYRCGTCGSTWLILRAVDAVRGARWEVSCGNEHRVVPIIGDEIVVRQAEPLESIYTEDGGLSQAYVDDLLGTEEREQ